MATDNDKIKKCLKSFLSGKKFLDIDKNKSFEYFKQTLKYISLIENKSAYNNILKETESECNNYITMSIEQTIEKNDKNKADIDLFKIIEKGDLTSFKNIKSSYVDFFIYDNDGNTVLHKAIKYGDTNFLKHCFKLGAPIDIVNMEGHTILEYACLEKDPNMINFMLSNGSDMKKHLYFRDGIKKYVNKQNYIDNTIILKMIFSLNESKNTKDLDFMFNYIDKNSSINFDNYVFNDLVKCLQTLLNNLDKDKKHTYLNIITDEIMFPLKCSLVCPPSKIDFILLLLVPFIEFPFNISLNWYLNLEFKYIFMKIIKEKNKFDVEEKNIIMNYIWDNYIKTKLFPDEYLGNLISQWVLFN